MARVKLLRQSLEDYNKKIMAGDAEYQSAYGVYSGKTDAYNAQINAFNQELKGLDAGEIIQDADGGLQQLDPKRGLIRYTGPTVDAFSQGPQPGPAYQDKGGGWFYDTPVLINDATYDDAGNQISPAQYGTRKTSIPVEVAHPGTAPAAPTQGAVPRIPNLTQGDIRELQNPGLDQAGMQMMANKGIIGKTELAGLDQSKISAFADPEDPNNLKEAGILARTLGGQL